MSTLNDEISRRRTFAIISHPDAGKTTLTEKFLLYGGAIAQAGVVKGKKNSRSATSDWMEIEKQRGISVTSSVILELHDRGGDRNASLLLDLHPVGGGRPGVLLALDHAGLGDGAAVEQEFFRQGGFTGVGVRNNGKGPAAADFFY